MYAANILPPVTSVIIAPTLSTILNLSVFWCQKMKTVSPNVLLLPETKSNLWSDT